MTKKIATSKERLLQFIDYKSISKQKFFQETGLKRGILDADKLKSSLSDNFIAKIIATYPEINIYWLLTGEGNMLTVDNYAKISGTGDNIDSKHKIPLVNIEAIGGPGNFESNISNINIKELYIIPKFKDRKVDFMIEVYGESMYPNYNSGDIVACRIIKESKVIQWNRVYVIGTIDNGILIKRIKQAKDNNYLLMVSDNKDYDPFLLPKNEITGIALVVGSIRLD